MHYADKIVVYRTVIKNFVNITLNTKHIIIHKNMLESKNPSKNIFRNANHFSIVILKILFQDD